MLLAWRMARTCGVSPTLPAAGTSKKRRKPYVAHMNGATDLQVCNELGLEPEELVRLKHITGYAKLYENNSFTRAAISENQARQLQKYRKEAGADGDC